MTQSAEEILDFWLTQGGPAAWYRSDPEFDAQISKRFGSHVFAAARGDFDDWVVAPRECLSLLILLDQFPRNIFRDDARAFACDYKARETTVSAIQRGHDGRFESLARQFFYTPLMHSEYVADQDRAVRLFRIHDPQGSGIDHARAHRLVIRRFGRFPYRNDVLGRTSTDVEREFIANGGYAAAFEEVMQTKQ